MTYKESLDFLFSQLPMFSRIGAAAYKPGLDTSIALDNYFGNPHRCFTSIHVAGTNGKGSTSHNIASILQQEGYKVGLYTSPHLADFRERIRVNGKMIPEQSVIDFVERWRECGYEGHPSFFELTMMMAFDWFAAQEVDYAVIEVGMGGRLDSTNIITPIACVITNISFDHTQFLGSTLPQIAGEKAGIIKSGIPVVIGHANGDVREVFEKRSAEVGAPIVFAEDLQPLTEATATEDFTLECDSATVGEFTSPLSGAYQKENINTVLSAVETLRNAGVEISDESVREGMKNVITNTGLAGRWMKVSDSPLTICDTGHNQAGLSITMPQLHAILLRHRQNSPDAQLRMVIGFVSDKDVAHIVDLLPKDAIYYVTQASVPRAMPAENLLPLLEGAGLNCRLIPEGVATAYKTALNDLSTPHDIIFIGGSTFIVADFLASLHN
ncbi:MAG: bifunctional folylpolyglutamate synthase/dihydrofolate synthase [Muribaculaceae bacterium]|nr:bifunctional folylpolyglutamate synthase/dihydrofolate synthase [Muribaculaceae bacterium]